MLKSLFTVSSGSHVGICGAIHARTAQAQESFTQSDADTSRAVLTETVVIGGETFQAQHINGFQRDPVKVRYHQGQV